MKTDIVKTKNNRSLTTTLALSFFGVSIVVLLISSGLQIFLGIQSQQIEIRDRQLLIAENARTSVGNFIEQKVNELETAVEFSNLSTASTAAKFDALDGILGLDRAFKQVSMLSNDTSLQAFASRSSQTPTSQFTSQITDDIYLTISLGQRFVISPIYFDENTGEPLLTLVLPYKTAAGEYRGILATEVSMRFLWDLVDQIRVGKSGYVYVVDNRGELIAYKDVSRVIRGEDASHISEVGEFLENPFVEDPTPNIGIYPGLNGDNVVGTYAPLETVQWAVVIEMPWLEAYQRVINLAWQSLALILIAAILAGLIGYEGARQTSSPLIDLSNVAMQIAGGNLNAQAQESGAVELVELASSFNTMTSQLRDSIGNLEKRVAERTADLETARSLSERRAEELQSISEISRLISSEQRLNVLLGLITQLVSERFDFYHVGIFFVDGTGQYAVLQAANSEGGKQMLARGHRLEVGRTGIVGNVAQTGEARIALDVGTDARYFNNPDLPETHSEMALPLNVHGKTIGVLDVQSKKPGAFTGNDAQTLSILADQIAVAIDNARLFGENKQALDEIQSLYNQYLRQEWKTFIQNRQSVGYAQSMVSGRPLDAPVVSDEIQRALIDGQVVVMGADGKSLPAIAVPVKLRDQIIGVLQIKAPSPNRRWNQDEINMAQAISDRLALALDNARLLLASQRQTAKEQKIGEVTAKIGASINMRSVLQTAVEELGRALPGSEVVIQFQSNGKQE